MDQTVHLGLRGKRNTLVRVDLPTILWPFLSAVLDHVRVSGHVEMIHDDRAFATLKLPNKFGAYFQRFCTAESLKSSLANSSQLFSTSCNSKTILENERFLPKHSFKNSCGTQETTIYRLDQHVGNRTNHFDPFTGPWS